MTSSKGRPILALAISTWFGCGYSPAAPGTAGSLGALLIAILLVHFLHWPPWTLAVLALALLPVGVWSSGVTARSLGKEDPGLVVVDEVIGQWITLAAVHSWNWRGYLAAFLLFRGFDIWKPFPARQAESLPGGVGIVADDVVAGVYGALVLLLAGCFNLY